MTIHEAAASGDLRRVRQILERDPGALEAEDEHGWRPLFHAALWRRLKVVQHLLDAGADVAAHDGRVMHYAGEVPENKQVVALLVAYGALEAFTRPPDDRYRQFIAAVFLDNAARVGAFLRRDPALARTPDGRGSFPLHHAARNGDIEVMEALIDHGADLYARSGDGDSVLFCAGGHGHGRAVRLLIERGLSPQHPHWAEFLEWARPLAERNHGVRLVVRIMERRE